MSDMKNILYGVTDFVEIRKHPGGYFVDRTALIRELEKTRYALFLRPRRFGKSLLVSILQCYYDLDYADRFDEIFGGTAIGANPTDERGKYLVLDFNFSVVNKQVNKVQTSFNDYVSLRIDKFVEDHAKILPAGTSEAVLAKTDCDAKFNTLAVRLKGTKTRFYILIDEYDNFTNTILAENGVEAYDALCHGEGFFKQFFTELKAATTGSDAPVTRLFITGVTPVTLDDVTSGFNIASNISPDPTSARCSPTTARRRASRSTPRSCGRTARSLRGRRGACERVGARIVGRTREARQARHRLPRRRLRLVRRGVSGEG